MTKGPVLQEIWDQLPEARKERIRARTAELDVEYRTLRELPGKPPIALTGLGDLMDMPPQQ